MSQNEVIIGADVEADGPIPGPYSMISLGLSVVGDPTQKFYTEIQPISDTFDPEALAISGLDRDRLLREAPPAKEAMTAAAEWIKARDGKPVFLAGPAVWDGMYIHWYFIKYLGYNPFGVTGAGIDLRSFWMGLMGCSWTNSRTTNIKRHVGTLGLIPHTHNAGDDAEELAEVFRRVLLEKRSTPIYLPSGVGEALMEAFGLPPGKAVGALRAQLHRLCVTGEIDVLREPSYYVEVVRSYNMIPPTE